MPSIARVLAGTGEFTTRPRKRYDDTELLLAEILEHVPGLLKQGDRHLVGMTLGIVAALLLLGAG